jgi:hypothetical protein
LPRFFEFSGCHEPFNFVPDSHRALLAIARKGGFDLPSYDAGSALVELWLLSATR